MKLFESKSAVEDYIYKYLLHIIYVYYIIMYIRILHLIYKYKIYDL